MTPILRNLAIAAAVLAGFTGAVLVVLVIAFDLRVEPAGSGVPLIFSFGDPDDHFAALEASRTRQRSIARPPAHRLPGRQPPT